MQCVAVCGLLLCVTLLSQGLVLVHGASEWNQKARDFVLKLENDKRRGEDGCSMNKLVYDMQLEKLAKKWAETYCAFDHELDEEAGANVAWGSNKTSVNEVIEDTVNRWFDEKKIYSFEQNSCSDADSCKHTQMMWRSTSKLGCYSTRCEDLPSTFFNSRYLVCFYAVTGERNGEKPYGKGCKQAGQTEENGLSVGEVGEKGRLDEDTEGDDNHGGCIQWTVDDVCDRNPDVCQVLVAPVSTPEVSARQLDYSAYSYDPIFFLHHLYYDRIWAILR